MANINRVVISGNLTKDPELRQLPSGNSVCKLRMAVNTRVKDRDSGQWTDRPNYFDVTVWGGQGESVAKLPVSAAPACSSTAASSGASGMPRTAPSARRSRSSPRTRNSWAAAKAAAAAVAAERPAGDFAPAGSAPMPTSAPIADDDDIPF